MLTVLYSCILQSPEYVNGVPSVFSKKITVFPGLIY